jgi:hypothetical protein
MASLWAQRRAVLWGAMAVLILQPVGSSWAKSDFQKGLERYNGQTVKGYVKPLVDLFGANMQAGFYHSASLSAVRPYVELDVIGMGSLVTSDQETYQARTPDGFDPATFETATLFGKEGATVTDRNNPQLQYRGSDGIIDATVFPLAVPQLSVGFLGTQAIARFIMTPKIGDNAFPKTTLLGLGLRHSVSQYFVLSPVEVTAGVFYNRFTIGDLVTYGGLSVGAQASRRFGLAEVYGGLAWDSSTMNVKYETEDPFAHGTEVDIDMKGDSTFRLTVGSALHLKAFKLFADANLGPVINFSGGIGVGL